MTTEACAICPHQSDCLKVGSCLDDLAPAIASRQFPQRMTPAQATRFMEALRVGQTQRRICGGRIFGPAIRVAHKVSQALRALPAGQRTAFALC
jgi:hypothetical protein